MEWHKHSDSPGSSGQPQARLRTAGGEWAERLVSDIPPDEGYRNHTPHDYTYGLSLARLRPALPDEEFEEQQIERLTWQQKIEPQAWQQRQQRAQRYARRQAQQEARRQAQQETVSRNPYPVSEPVIAAPVKSKHPYSVVQPVILMPKPPWWKDMSRHVEVMDDLESLLTDS